MGLRDLFKKKEKDKKEEVPTDFALNFKESFEKCENKPNHIELGELLKSWGEFLNDDANYHFASIILSLIKNEECDYEELFNKANNLKPINETLYPWFKYKAEYLIKIHEISFINKENEFMHPDENEAKERNFKYLDDLIHSSLNEIILDFDIALGDDEELEYLQGISLDVDGISINGNGHYIDAKGKSRILNISGKNITLKNLILRNSFSENGGAIYNTNNDILNIIHVQFINNFANRNGGAILNEIGSYGTINVKNCLFNGNNSRYGGAINNQEYNEICIFDSEFINNNSVVSGGGITNIGKAYLKKVEFKENNSKYGGSITNFGYMHISDSLFEKNGSNDGSAINVQEGTVEVLTSRFLNNASKNSGGAIFNASKLNLNESYFEGNHSSEAGAIFLAMNSSSRIDDCTFYQNKSLFHGAALCNEGTNTRIIKSTFLNNENEFNVIYNSNFLELLSVEFKNNSSKNIILNDFNSKLDIQFNKFLCNTCSESVINNSGEFCAISNGKFKNNHSKIEFCEDILNNTTLDITNPNFSKDTPTILNKGLLNARKFKEIDRHVKNESQIESFDIDSPYNHEFNFSFLDELIHKGEKKINLNQDIFLDNYEIDFYEGGVDLDIDGLVIEGHGHFIDGHGKSRIFNVIGKDIILKNIIFRNASFLTNFDSQASGGGAINNIKDASLELNDCQFINNNSQGNGGAIRNNGDLSSDNCIYSNNSSKYDGGAIFNAKFLEIENNTFKENESKIGSAIYSKDNLTINKKSIFLNNISDFSQPIYSIGSIENNGFGDDLNDLIYNPSISTPTSNIGSFSYLEKEIQNNEFITLKKDIIFDISTDKQLIDGISIVGKLIIDGNGYCIDGKEMASLFNIAPDGHVTFKNIKFINAHSNACSIISNKGNLSLESCEFNNNSSFGENSLIDNKKFLRINDLNCFNNSSKNKSLINNESDLEIKNSKFINNQSYADGTVIFNKSKTYIIDSSFQSNNSKADGGAITNWEKSYLEINNVIFMNNLSEKNGGAIKNSGNLKVSHSKFENGSSINGAALYSFYGLIEISNTHFRNNISQVHAGAIANIGDSNIKIIDCEFLENSSEKSGAIANDGELELYNSIFLNNSSKTHGGVIYNENNATIDNSKFISNTSEKLGGVILNTGEIVLRNSKFENNSSLIGAAIECSKGYIEIISTEFLNNNALKEGGAISNFAKIRIIKSLFENNDSGEIGGAISNKTLDSLFLENYNYLKETVNTDDTGIIEINETSFLKNSAIEAGGAILNLGNITLFNSHFESNKSSLNGGAINSQKGIVTIKYTEFIKNKAETGAAIINFDTVDISNSKFELNKSKKHGGSLFNQPNANAYIENTIFFKNFTKEFGGAIINGGRIEILGSTFDSNHARREGGAINNQESGILNLKNTRFINNRAVAFGAIYSAKSQNNNINNCEFENNIPDIGIIMKNS